VSAASAVSFVSTPSLAAAVSAAVSTASTMSAPVAAVSALVSAQVVNVIWVPSNHILSL